MAYYVTGTVDRCPQFREINFPLLRDKPSILLSLDLPFSLSLFLSLSLFIRIETQQPFARYLSITELLHINLRGYVFVAMSSVSKLGFAPPQTSNYAVMQLDRSHAARPVACFAYFVPIPRFFSPPSRLGKRCLDRCRSFESIYIYIFSGFNARYVRVCAQICIFRKIVGEDVAVHRFQIARMITENALVTVL